MLPKKYRKNYNLYLKLYSKIFIENFISEKIIKQIYVNRYRKKGIIFIHIPKAAGTSITNTIIGKRVGHLKAKEVKQVMGEQQYNSYFSFSVTRNPYNRILSAYFYAKNDGGEDGVIRPNKEYKMNKFSSFKKFVMEWLPSKNIYRLDNVFKPQWTYVYDKNILSVDYLGRLENIKEVEKVLSDKLKKNIYIDHSNKGRNVVEVSKYYDEEMKRMIYNLYKYDFDLLDYRP